MRITNMSNKDMINAIVAHPRALSCDKSMAKFYVGNRKRTVKLALSNTLRRLGKA